MKLTDLSDVQLEQLIQEFSQSSFSADALIRKVCIAEFGNDHHVQMLGLAVQMLPILMNKIKEAKTTYCGNSYSMGWIEHSYALSRTVDERYAQRYLDLCVLTGQQGDTELLEAIDKYVPSAKRKTLAELS